MIGDAALSRTQLMIPERPLPERLAVARPATSPAETRNAPAFVPPPTYPPPRAKNALSRVRATVLAADGHVPELKIVS